MNQITIHNLRKQFGNQVILADVNMTVPSEKIVGLIGPSGAGKSTLIKTTLGMEKATAGEALVLQTTMPNRKILGRIGYMAQSDALYESLTAQENLVFFGKMRGLNHQTLTTQIQQAATTVALTADLDKPVSDFSGGMKRRLSLAIALLGNPELLILDEPTVGIDPALRHQIWAELVRRRDQGTGILVTTHVMDEAELVDEVNLLMQGRIIATDSPQNLKHQYQVDSIEAVFLAAEHTLED